MMGFAIALSFRYLSISGLPLADDNIHAAHSHTESYSLSETSSVQHTDRPFSGIPSYH